MSTITITLLQILPFCSFTTTYQRPGRHGTPPCSPQDGSLWRQYGSGANPSTVSCGQARRVSLASGWWHRFWIGWGRGAVRVERHWGGNMTCSHHPGRFRKWLETIACLQVMGKRSGQVMATQEQTEFLFWRLYLVETQRKCLESGYKK